MTGEASSDNEGRYFLAIWPDAPVRDQLSRWSRQVAVDPAARRVPDVNLHITLVFLGALDAPAVEAVRKTAGAVSWRPARLVIDRIGHWKRSGIVWAGSRDGARELSAAVSALRDGLRRKGFRIDHRAFVPHVTLFRKAARKPRWEPWSIEWRIDELCLVQSALAAEGVRYAVIHRWPARNDVE